MRTKALPLLVLPLISVAAAVIYLVAVQDRLPSEVATHWGPSGEADGFSDPAALPWLFGGLSIVVGGLMATLASVIRAPSVLGLRFLYGLPLGIVWFIATIGVVTTAIQVDTTVAPAFPGWVVPVAVVAGLAGGALGALVAGRDPAAPSTEDPAPPSADRHPMDAGHTAVWTGSTPWAGALPVLAAIVAVLGIGLSLVVGWWLMAIFLPLLALLMSSTSYRVAVGPTGLKVAGRLFGFPRVRLPIEQIRSAEAGEVRAMDFGGWGLRQGLSGETAVITRTGPALVLTRTDGAVLRVSMDDPEEPAAVMSTLLDRR